ncbi:hypothetical protein [Lacinutrix sp. Hel_I_90]|uniref:hypothetical protein n=1 Tax=Lacinutrix sp. Hel_I_90 TaxID=1249999 RepID=UPI0005C93192|nr:hypothetical protein [Lacinutrix sp. Hel_I_90]
MQGNFPAGEVKIFGRDITDAVKRKNIIDKLQSKVPTEALEKLDLMISEKGLKALDKKWNLISKFI